MILMRDKSGLIPSRVKLRFANTFWLNLKAYQRIPNDHLPLKLLYRSAFIENPVKYIFSEILTVKDYEDIFK